MEIVEYIDRKTQTLENEKVFKESIIRFFYGKTFFEVLVCHPIAKLSAFSRFYGWLQDRPSSRKRVMPFIEKFHMDTNEFLDPVESYRSFNDFFIRKLKPEARPIAQGNDIAIIPADGRYRFFQDIKKGNPFSIKQQPFDIESFFQDKALADKYDGANLVLARLCPTDCHRFYFPVSGLVRKTRVINGALFSVNPIATTFRPWIWTENKRTVTLIETKEFGTVAYCEIGATCVGSIHQTYISNETYQKGDEKGYFSFGGSALAIFFEKGRIQFDSDLVELSKQSLEIRCLIGESLGIARTTSL